MKHYRIRTETAVIGSNLPCAVCGDRSSELAIVPIGLPPVVGVHKRCIDKLHRKRGGEEQASGDQEQTRGPGNDQKSLAPADASKPEIATTTPARGPEEAGPERVQEKTQEREELIRRAIAEKILPEGLPYEQAWTRLLNAAPQGWFKKNQEAPGERIDFLQLSLSERGVKMTLPDLCAWSVLQRDVARAWLEQGGDRPTFFPSACAACDNGVPNDKENGYKHTGEGPGCGKDAVRATSSQPNTEGVAQTGIDRFCPKCGVETGENMPGTLCQDCVKAPSFIEQGAPCPACGKPIPERNSSRVGDELFCSAKCALPKGVSAAERTIPLPLPVRRFEF